MWHHQAKHCPLCAAFLVLADVEGRPRKRCPRCTFVLFHNPASAAAGVVLDDERRVLLIRRRIQPYKGDWALPAGYQELDEAPAEAAVREVEEETGIVARAIELMDLIHVPTDPRKPANVAVFLCHRIGGTLRAADDAAEVEWFALDRLPPNIGFDNNRRILARLGDPADYAGRPWPPPPPGPSSAEDEADGPAPPAAENAP